MSGKKSVLPCAVIDDSGNKGARISEESEVIRSKMELLADIARNLKELNLLYFESSSGVKVYETPAEKEWRISMGLPPPTQMNGGYSLMNLLQHEHSDDGGEEDNGV